MNSRRTRPWYRWLLWLGLAAGVHAQTTGWLSGKLQLPSGLGVSNGTLLLQLSQQAYLDAGSQVAPAQVSCYTSIDGTVVGLPNPGAAPVVNPFPGIGTLPAATYFVETVYTGASPSGARSLVSPEAQVTLSSTGNLVVTAPTVQPATATGYAVYIGTSSGTETLQGTVTGWSDYTQSVPLTNGTARPGTNNSQCQLYFNDTMVPSYTYYEATLEDAAGNVEPGFPRGWYLYGLQADVGKLTPLASNPAVAFPMPVLQNPVNPLVGQSVFSVLNLNGLAVHATSNLGPGYFGLFWSGALPAVNGVLGVWTPNAAVTIQRLDLNAQTAGAGGSSGTGISLSDGTTTCTWTGMLAGAATSGTAAHPLVGCQFNAGVPITIRVYSDDHTTAPQNLNLTIETTGS